MSDDFNKDTSLEDEIAKSLQKMAEEETTVAKAFVGTENGVVEKVYPKAKPDTNAEEILAYLNGEMSLETAVNILKRDTRHFAKRQLTWFRRERDVRFLYLPEFDNDRERVLEHILQELAAGAGIMECDS